MSEVLKAIKLAISIMFRKPVPWAKWHNRIMPWTAWQVGKIVWLEDSCNKTVTKEKEV